jgi:hypothetical protein
LRAHLVLLVTTRLKQQLGSEFEVVESEEPAHEVTGSVRTTKILRRSTYCLALGARAHTRYDDAARRAPATYKFGAAAQGGRCKKSVSDRQPNRTSQGDRITASGKITAAKIP